MVDHILLLKLVDPALLVENRKWENLFGSLEGTLLEKWNEFNGLEKPVLVTAFHEI